MTLDDAILKLFTYRGLRNESIAHGKGIRESVQTSDSRLLRVCFT